MKFTIEVNNASRFALDASKTNNHAVTLSVRFVTTEVFLPLNYLIRVAHDCKSTLPQFDPQIAGVASRPVDSGFEYILRVITSVPASVIQNPPFPWSVSP